MMLLRPWTPLQDTLAEATAILAMQRWLASLRLGLEVVEVADPSQGPLITVLVVQSGSVEASGAATSRLVAWRLACRQVSLQLAAQVEELAARGTWAAVAGEDAEASELSGEQLAAVHARVLAALPAEGA